MVRGPRGRRLDGGAAVSGGPHAAHSFRAATAVSAATGRAGGVAAVHAACQFLHLVLLFVLAFEVLFGVSGVGRGNT